MQNLKCPADSSGASVGGNWYQADSGFIAVPDDCVGVLLPLGFVLVVDEPTEEVRIEPAVDEPTEESVDVKTTSKTPKAK